MLTNLTSTKRKKKEKERKKIIQLYGEIAKTLRIIMVLDELPRQGNERRVNKDHVTKVHAQIISEQVKINA